MAVNFGQGPVKSCTSSFRLAQPGYLTVLVDLLSDFLSDFLRDFFSENSG